MEECWSELFLLNAVQWCLPVESSPLFSVSEHAATVPNGKASQIAADVRILNDMLLRYKTVGVDPAEFACLKAIVLFKCGKYFVKRALNHAKRGQKTPIISFPSVF